MLDRHRPDIPLGIQIEQRVLVELASFSNPPTAMSRSIGLPSHSERDVSAET